MPSKRLCENIGPSHGTLDLCEPRAREDALRRALECHSCSHGNYLVFDMFLPRVVLDRLMNDLDESVSFLTLAASRMLTGLMA